MGRTLKRVPLDFDWPLKKTWGGYINPWYAHCTECHRCGGCGYNPETKRISDDFYDFERTGRRWCSDITQDEVDALIAARRLTEFTHTFTPGKGWEAIDPQPQVTPEQINQWNERSMGHDAINRGILIEARAKRLGVWGTCELCNGEGELWTSEESKVASEAWEPHEPPTGDGFQLWETTSEGSPASPVFETIHELCAWCEFHATTFGSHMATAEEWRSMLDKDFVCHREGNMVFL